MQADKTDKNITAFLESKRKIEHCVFTLEWHRFELFVEKKLLGKSHTVFALKSGTDFLLLVEYKYFENSYCVFTLEWHRFELFLEKFFRKITQCVRTSDWPRFYHLLNRNAR